MKKYFYFILLIIISSSCTEQAKWFTTKEDLGAWNIINNGSTYSWKGGNLGSLVHGKGELIEYNKSGKIVSRNTYIAKCGILTEDNKKQTPVGTFYGEEVKNAMPHSLGLLICNDSIVWGDFSKGKLSNGKVLYAKEKGGVVTLIYDGYIKRGKFHGVGNYYINGILEYSGSFKKGVKNGVGQEYSNNLLMYEGGYKNGQRHGYGKEYGALNDASVFLRYVGEFEDNLYDGYGKLYNENILIYEGGWKQGVYHGEGKLYDKGKCVEGTWKRGLMSKTYLTSIVDQTKRTVSILFGDNVEGEEYVYTDLQLSSSEEEFIQALRDDLRNEIEENIDEKVSKRFGFWEIIRMLRHSVASKDINRIISAEEYFKKGLDEKELERLINAKIDYFNSKHSTKLKYVSLSEIPQYSIVTTDVALKIFDRESMELADVVIGWLIDILIIWVVGFIIGFIIGLLAQFLLPFIGIIDICLTVLALVMGLYVAFFYETPIMLDLEAEITRMIIDNYLYYIDAQNIIPQIVG